MLVSNKELLEKVKQVSKNNAIDFDKFTIKGDDYGVKGDANHIFNIVKECLKWYAEKGIDRCTKAAKNDWYCLWK